MTGWKATTGAGLQSITKIRNVLRFLRAGTETPLRGARPQAGCRGLSRREKQERR